MRASLIAILVTLAAAAHADERSPVLQRVHAQLSESVPETLYLLVDKPLYRPGETIWFRGWELSLRSFAHAGQGHGITYTLLDPGGATVLEKRVRYAEGVAANDFVLGAGLAGGEYTLRAVSDRGPRAERMVRVSAYELPRIKKTLVLRRKSYAPGDEVSATLTALDASGKPLAGAQVIAIIRLDGSELERQTLVTNGKGAAGIRFRLPATVALGDGLLTVIVDGGGVSEAIARRIPIVASRVEVALFPEGGDLVVGLPGRVYFMARTPLGAAAEVAGEVVDDTGAVVARVASVHDGMGRFALTPKTGRSYRVRLTKPTAQETPLPAAREDGCALVARDDFKSKKKHIIVEARCTSERSLTATAVLHEKLIASAEVVVGAKKSTPIKLAIPSGPQGAVRVTLFAGDVPLAERLIYRGLRSDLSIRIKADRPAYAPRDRVTLTIETRGADGKPVASDVAVAVVDDTLLSLADDDSGSLLAHLYLLPEMPGQRIDEPDFYFSGAPGAPQAIDLLLGTKGWRRFAWRWVASR